MQKQMQNVLFLVMSRDIIKNPINDYFEQQLKQKGILSLETNCKSTNPHWF